MNDEITHLSLVKIARSSLKMEGAEFGEWLAEQVGREEPFPTSRICEWEKGLKSPRKNIRIACAPIAAKAIAEKIISEHPDKTVLTTWIEKILI